MPLNCIIYHKHVQIKELVLKSLFFINIIVLNIKYKLVIHTKII